MNKDRIPSFLSCVWRTVCALTITSLGTGLRTSAQTPSTDLSFEVATVKPVADQSRFDPHHFWAHVTPAGASYWSMSPIYLIDYAYDVQPFQVVGPDWANADRFDIEARLPEGADKKDDKKMLQTLLKERFKLTFHMEKRELDGYVLLVGKHGAKLRPSLPDPVVPETAPIPRPEDTGGQGPAKSNITKNPDGSSTVDMGKRGTQTIKFDQEKWAMHWSRSKMTTEELADRLRNCLGSGDHKIFDETGIKGTYQIEYDCPSPGPRPPASTDAAGGMLPSDPQGGSALTQSLEALGLKLEKRKTLQEVYVIDHVERPSEN